MAKSKIIFSAQIPVALDAEVRVLAALRGARLQDILTEVIQAYVDAATPEELTACRLRSQRPSAEPAA